MASRGFYRFYTGTESGTYDFASGNSTIIHVYRGVDAADPIGDFDGGGSGSTTISYPALTLEVTDGPHRGCWPSPITSPTRPKPAM